MKNNTKTIRRLIKYILKHKLKFFVSLISQIFIVVGTLLIPIIIGKEIDSIIGQNNVNFENILSKSIYLIFIIIVVGLLEWTVTKINNQLTCDITYNLRKEGFEKIQTLPLSYIDKYSYGEIVSRVMNDVNELGDGLLMLFNQLFRGISTVIGILICILVINPLIALLVLVLTPLSLFVAKFISGKTFSLFKTQAELKSNQTAFIEERISNQKILIAYNQQETNSKQFAEINKKLSDTALGAIFYSSLTNPCTRFVNAVIYAIVVICGSLLAIKLNNPLSIGSLSTLLYYANQYSKPFNEITGVFTELQNTIVCSQRIFELLDATSQTQEENTITIDNPQGKINFKNVYFSYLPNKKLIENFSLNVSKGQRVAIVGPTGSGKTTIINLLMRFYDVNSGKITIDDNDITDISRNDVRKYFGMVLQETFLKSGTIKDNIKLGKPNATMEEIIEASKLSHSYDFIKKLKNEFDTEIDENGGNLSQGQKQLLCITRVMLCLPPMLILDEATSNIDTRTELKIQNAFNTLMQGKTSFIVAHRLSTIKNVDLILVLKDGQIIEQGNHKDLLKKRGFYYELFNSQFK